MEVLSAWSILNLATGIPIASGIQSDQRYFYRMNSYFGGVNLLLSGIGYFSARKKPGQPVSLTQALKKQNKLERVFLINTGLDLAYILGGLYWREKGQHKTGLEHDKALGYGNSIMLQGGFLFFFDGIQYTLHRKNGNNLRKINVEVAPGRLSLTLNL